MPIPAKPTVSPDWATNTNYAGGIDVGTPTKIDPGAGQRADGWRGAEGIGAAQLNHLHNAQGQWIEWAEAGIDDLAARVGGDDGSAEWAYPTPRARSIVIPACAIGGGSQSRMGDSGQRVLAADSSFHWLNLSRYLPNGAVVLAVHAIIEPGEARAVNLMTMALTHNTAAYDFINPPVAPAPVIVDDVNDDGTADLQTVSLTGLSHTIESGTSGASGRLTQLLFQAGGTATANPDVVWAINVQFDDPGPTNV